MSLILPSYLIPKRRPAGDGTQRVASFVGWKELTGKGLEVADLVADLSTLRRTAVIRLVTWLLNQVGSQDSVAAGRQMPLAEFMLPHDLLSAYKATTPAEHRVVFHSHQLRFLLQMAVISSRDTTPDLSDEELRHNVGRACLMVNGLLEEMQIAEVSDDEAADLKWLGTSAIYLRDPTENSVLPQFARAQRMWFDLPHTDEIQTIARNAHVSLDFEAIFTAKCGLPLADFLAVLYAVISAFEVQEDKGPMLLDIPQLFPNSAELIRTALSPIATTPDELARSLMREPRQGWFSDMTTVMANPLIEVEPNKYACPDVAALRHRLTDGIYWLLSDWHPDGTDQFRTIFGHIYERYIRDIFGAFTYANGDLARSFFPSPRFDGTQDEAADGIILWLRSVVVFECKARLLSTRQRYTGDINITFGGIDALFGGDTSSPRKKGVRQLANNITRLLAGERTISQGQRLPSLTNELILPVLVTFDEACAVHPIRKYLDQKLESALTQAGVTDMARVGPLLLLSTRDVELLDGLSSTVEIEQFLRDYSDHLSKSTGLEMGAFQSFAYAKRPKVPDTESFVRKTANEFRKRMIAHGIAIKLLGPEFARATDDNDQKAPG